MRGGGKQDVAGTLACCWRIDAYCVVIFYSVTVFFFLFFLFLFLVPVRFFFSRWAPEGEGGDRGHDGEGGGAGEEKVLHILWGYWCILQHTVVLFFYMYRSIIQEETEQNERKKE